jgi:transposase-like protein
MTPLEQKVTEKYGADLVTARAAIRERMSDGVFISTLARELGVSRPALSKWLRATPDDEQLVKDAREEGAHAVAEEAVSEFDHLDPSMPARDAIALARERSAVKRWMASKMNADYDDKPAGPAVQITMGKLFLEAAARPGVQPPPKPPAVDAEVEVEALPPAPAPKAKMSQAEIDRTAREHELIKEAMAMGLGRDAAVRFAVNWCHAHPPASFGFKRVQDMQDGPDD